VAGAGGLHPDGLRRVSNSMAAGHLRDAGPRTSIFMEDHAHADSFLFAQAKGRDLWQSPMFLWHLLLHALIAGAAVLIIVGWFLGEFLVIEGSMFVLMLAMMVSLLMVLAELALPHVSEDAKQAADTLTRGPLRLRFWALAIGAGLLLPIVLAISVLSSKVEKDFTSILVAILALAGVWFFEDVWVKAGQAVELS
jgi:Ni/Fe-hydrogenase subunit HybB-like protein